MIRVVEIGERPVEALSPNPDNPRFITEERFEQLKRALEGSPDLLRAHPLWIQADGMVLGGNMRLRAMQALGWETATVAVLDGTEEELRVAALQDNGDYGEWDETQLAEWLVWLREHDVDLDLTGLPTTDVQMLLDGVGALPAGPKKLDEESMTTDYECPHCGYAWSGLPKPQAKASVTA